MPPGYAEVPPLAAPMVSRLYTLRNLLNVSLDHLERIRDGVRVR